MSSKIENSFSKTMRVRGLGWNGLVTTHSYDLGEEEAPASLIAAKRFTREFEEIYYVEVETVECIKTTSLCRIGTCAE